MRIRLLVVALAMVGCSRHHGHVDASPSPASCETLDACEAAREEVYTRLHACRGACRGLYAELAEVNRRLSRLRIEDRERQHEALERRRENAAAEARAAAEQEAEEKRGEDEAAWAAIDPEPCRQSGEPEDCEAIHTYETTHPNGAHVPEAERARADGQAKRAARIAEAQARARAEERKAAEAAARARASAAAKQGDEEDTGNGHVRCCDGTLSPTCTTVHRGCCSHHGGVCN